MRACSVYNGLILCRRHCFTYCSTQLKVLTNVFCLEYCTEVIYVYMYSFMNVFLNPYTRTECNFFVILFAIYIYKYIFVSLKTFPTGRACFSPGGPVPFTVLYTVCLMICVLKEQLRVWNKHEFCLAKCIFIYLNRHDGFWAERIAFPSTPLRSDSRFICQTDGVVIFVLENVCRMVTLMTFLYLTFTMVW